MKRVFAGCLVLVAFLLSGWVHGGGGVVASCPFGVSADGCTAGQTDSSFSGLTAGGPPVTGTYTVQHADFFTAYAPQAGQSYVGAVVNASISGTSLTVNSVTSGTVALNQNVTGTGIPNGVYIVSGTGPYTLSQSLGTVSSEAMTLYRRPTWNVAGVDYPVGVRQSQVPLKDPTSPVISGCTYCPVATVTSPCGNGTSNSFAIPAVVCTGLGANPTIQGYDFGTASQAGNSCVALYIESGSGTLTFSDNRWVNTSQNCSAISTSVSNVEINLCDGSSFTKVVVQYNYIDLMNQNDSVGGGLLERGIQCAGTQQGTAPVTFEAMYNYVNNDGCDGLIGKGMSGTNSGSFMLYNMTDGVFSGNNNACHTHQHWMTPDGGVSIGKLVDAWNTYLTNLNSYGGTAQLWLRTGVNGGETATNTYVENETFVSNGYTTNAFTGQVTGSGASVTVTGFSGTNTIGPTGGVAHPVLIGGSPSSPNNLTVTNPNNIHSGQSCIFTDGSTNGTFTLGCTTTANAGPANMYAVTSGLVSPGQIQGGGQTYTNMDVSNNYWDANGAAECFDLGPIANFTNAPTGTGNVMLSTGTVFNAPVNSGGDYTDGHC